MIGILGGPVGMVISISYFVIKSSMEISGDDSLSEFYFKVDSLIINKK